MMQNYAISSLAYAARTYFLSPRKKVSKESSRLNLLNEQLQNINVFQLSDSYCYRRVSKLRPESCLRLKLLNGCILQHTQLFTYFGEGGDGFV